MTWFCKFVHQSSAHPVSLPLFVNHNFPQLGPEDFFEAEIPQAVATLSKSYMPPLPPSAAGEPAHGSPKSKSPSTLSDTILPTVHHLTLNKPNITRIPRKASVNCRIRKSTMTTVIRTLVIRPRKTPSRKEKDASATLARLLGIENSADDSEEEEERMKKITRSQRDQLEKTQAKATSGRIQEAEGGCSREAEGTAHKKEDGRRKSDREGSGNGGEGSQREEIVDSTPLERENAPAAGKKNRFFGYPPRK
ncbi:hypothetical protein B0H14DRAFT_3132807 [Mycena olivaceomarginata]|nr:hypothetical protein B0H14DRAFT_3132807 [Mycena olivaceomarginata]